MIKARRMTPEVYNRQSRDFQFIGRLYDMVLNSVKTNADMIYSLPNSEDANTAFLELLSMTLGFKSIHNYNVDQLKALCSCFAEVIRNKGNIQSIEKACNAVVGAEGITNGIYIDGSDYKNGLTLYISQELSDINLLKDLMNYILPAGLSYHIVKTLQTSGTAKSTTAISHSVSYVGGTDKPDSLTSQTGDTFASAELQAPELMDTPSTMINSMIIDTYYESYSRKTGLEAVAEMTLPSGAVLEMTNGEIEIDESALTLSITANGGYELKNYSEDGTPSYGIWFRREDGKSAAYRLDSSEITVTANGQSYTAVIKTLPSIKTSVIAEFVSSAAAQSEEEADNEQ